MTVDVRWPALLAVPHYQVMRWHPVAEDGWPESGTLHADRRQADWEIQLARDAIARTGTNPDYYTFDIVVHDPVFLPRCGQCADLPDDRYQVFAYWDELCDGIRDVPGWQATSEQVVFCPRHLPSDGW
ncbi:hypothetical protein ABZ863_23475 [Saccharomonospora sp. NPDC046836]|uniref:hypothetical protein n=1 Tax=Saccharomonospora sp. NPDC046836 TaxID=3156921 RepID=UPI0034077561